MSECTHDCSSCGVDCASRQNRRASLKHRMHYRMLRRSLRLSAGKGGVGKSLVTSFLPFPCKEKRRRSASWMPILQVLPFRRYSEFRRKATGNEAGIFPAKTKMDIDIMSVNLFLQE